VTRLGRLSAAVDRLAAAVPDGALMASTDPAALLDAAAALIDSARRDGAEAMRREAVECCRSEYRDDGTAQRIETAIMEAKTMTDEIPDWKAIAETTHRLLVGAQTKVCDMSDLVLSLVDALEREHGKRDHAGRSSDCATCVLIRDVRGCAR
jgi:hypothetical protein